MDDHDLETWPDAELYRVVGIMMCERMLYARDAEVEANIDRRIAALEHEISKRTTLKTAKRK